MQRRAQKTRRSLVSTLAIIAIFCGLNPVPAHGETSGEGSLLPGGVKGVVRERDPATGNLVPVKVGTPESNYGFFYRPVCFDEETGFIDCLASQRMDCNDGPDGQYVWWYSGLKTNPRSTWAKYGNSPTCIYAAEAEEVGIELVGLVISAFQTAPIIPGKLIVQPSPHTLVGMNTNVYVESDVQTFNMILLGQAIEIRVVPTEYEWNYGNGQIYGPSAVAGIPLLPGTEGVATDTTYVYTESGDYFVSVSVYYSGTYSINGGPMIPIDGRAITFPAGQPISVWKSESSNVADDCLKNPAGFGC